MLDPLARWLPASDAARYVGLETEGFRRAVRRGTFPKPSYAIGKQSPRWDRVALDRVMGATDARDDAGEMTNAICAEIEQKAQNSAQTSRRRHDQRVSV